MHLYIFGGTGEDKRALKDLYTLNLATGEWKDYQGGSVHQEKAPSRINHATAVVGCKLYVHGGYDGETWYNSLHILDTKSYDASPWEEGHPTGPPSARTCHALTNLNHKLYMFGGCDGSRYFNDVHVLDLGRMIWSQPDVSGPKPQCRAYHTMTAIGDQLYVIGGEGDSGVRASRDWSPTRFNDVHILDTIKMQWIQTRPSGTLPPALRGHTAHPIGNKILVFGGQDDSGNMLQLHTFDTADHYQPDGRWIPCSEDPKCLPRGRMNHGASVLGSKRIYVFGGFDCSEGKWLNDLHNLDPGILEENALHNVGVDLLCKNIGNLLNNREFSDITFVVEGQEIYAHKAILVAQCEPFRDMFMCTDGKIPIHEWSHTAFHAMLESLYTGNCPQKLTPNQMTEVLGLVDRYMCDWLKNAIEKYLINLVNNGNCCFLMRRADEYGAQELKEHCLEYITRDKKHFQDISRSKEFDKLGPKLCLELVNLSGRKNKT